MSDHDYLTRADWLRSAGAAGVVLLIGASAPGNDKWRKVLTPAQYAILRENGTEPPFSSPLLKEHRAGTYYCAGCALALFSSKAKYESGDGWPSFTAPLAGAIATRADYDLVDARTEVHCKRCGGHLGHVFDDGPPPAHLRYCIDGLALHFVPMGSA